MAATGRYRLPPRPALDNWSTREKLALACSVMRSGDQNWVSVSRTIRAYAETERAEAWFSQKNCALQYADLLEKVETPKRKRGDKEKEPAHVETPGNVIVSRLTVDRIEELQTLVRDAQDKYRKLKEEVEAIKAGQHDDKLKELWESMQPAPEPSAPAPEAVATTTVAAAPVAPVAPTDTAPAMSDSQADTQDVQHLEDCVSPLPVLPPDVLEAALELQSPNITDLLHTSPSDPNALANIDVSAVLNDAIKDEPVDVEVVDETLPEIKVEVEDPQPIPAPPVVENTQQASKPVEMAAPPVVEVSQTKQEVEQAVKPVQEPAKPPLEVKVKEEPVEEVKKETSAPPPTPTTLKERKVEEEDAESTADGFPDTPAATHMDEEQPSSPSSIVSCDTDGGSRGKGRSRVRGRRGRPSRGAGARSSRKVTEDDKDIDMSSKAESSDEDEESKNEESDTASTAHVRSNISESMPNSPASTFGPTFNSEEEEKAHKIWKKSIMLVWRAAANHKYANVFLHPVTEDIAPGYHSVVHKPMNLMQVKKNIEGGHIRLTAEFQRDMMLMFTNAIMYNNSDHDVCKMATEMYDDVMHHIEQYVLTQQMISKDTPKSGRHRRSEISEAPPPESTGGKLLRGRRSEAGASSDKEDERKRRVSMDTSDSGGKVKKRKA